MIWARRRRVVVAGLVLVICAVASACAAQETRPASTAAGATTPDAGPRLVWHDEFDGTLGPDWVFDIGTGHNGWGNNEHQYYTSRPENVRVEGGVLVIEARNESYEGRLYTSARLKTLGKAAFTYGRFEARIQIPRGQGIWPAFWALGSDIGQVGWPNCGEIDVMENVGREPATVHGTLHGPGYSGGQSIGAPYSLTSGAFADTFHVFAAEWTPTSIVFSVDGTAYKTVTPADLTGTWVFHKPFFLLLNLAVGGNWPGPPAPETPFPARMLVDYVRVYDLAR